MRGKVTAMIAPGGVGKSSLVNAMTRSAWRPAGSCWARPSTAARSRVVLWNLEDDGDSLARQRVAAAIHYGIKPAERRRRPPVRRQRARTARALHAVEDRNGFTIIEPVMENITAAIQRRASTC
jgi:ABC-type branched-subunit amino acid transport system ATPase component